MFVRLHMPEGKLNQYDLIKQSVDLNKSDDWKLVSASTIIKNEYKESAAKLEMVQAYLHSAEILSEALSENTDNVVSLRSVCMPFLYMCRHTAELAIKLAIEIVGVKVKPTHNIKLLWEKFILEVQDCIREEETEFVSRLSDFIEILSMIDDDGCHLRYAISNNNELYRDKPFLINPKNFVNELFNLVTAVNFIDPRHFE